MATDATSCASRTSSPATARMTILHGLSLQRRARRDHHRHRPERRRQVDRVQGGVRHAAGALRAHRLRRPRDHQSHAARADRRAASATCRRGATSFPSCPCCHNLELGGVAAPKRLRPRRRASRRRWTASRCCAARRDAQASTLSGGEQKMLEIARGLLLEPEADADRRAVDRAVADPGARSCSACCETCATRGITVLMIEQNAKRALENSDYGIVLELGRTRIAGPRARRSSPIRASGSCFSAAGWSRRRRRSRLGMDSSTSRRA